MSTRVFSFKFCEGGGGLPNITKGLIEFGYKSMRKVEFFWEGPPLYNGDMQECMV